MIRIHVSLLNPTDSPLRVILIRPVRDVLINGVVGEQSVDISAATVHMEQSVPSIAEIVPDNTPISLEDGGPADVAVYDLPAEVSGGAYKASGFVTIDGTPHAWHLDFSL